MSGRVKVHVQSNSRVAWLVAGAAVVAMLALPEPVQAQFGPSHPNPNGHPPAQPIFMNAGSRTQPGTRRRSVDMMDLRDRAENQATIIKSAGHLTPAVATFTPSATSADVVCLAGCDGPTGKVVYHGVTHAPPALAAVISNPPPLNAAIAQPTVVIAAVNANDSSSGGVITCLAGCYDNQSRSTAVTPTATVAATLVNTTIRLAHVSEPKLAAPSIADTVAKIADPPQPTRMTMKTGFVPHQRGHKAGRSVAAKSRAKITAARTRGSTPLIAKTVAIRQQSPTVRPAQPDQITAPAVVVKADPETAAAKIIATAIKVEKAKPKRVPLANASNDWFNRINRDRKVEPVITTIIE